MGADPQQNKDIKASTSRPGRFGPRALFRVLAVVTIAVPVALVQNVVILLRLNNWWPVTGLWNRIMTGILDIQVVVHGDLVENRSVLYAANHISWADIFVLGGVLPRASFVAKHEISKVGPARWLAGLGKTIYVDRARRTETHSKANELASRVADGDSLILFPESTTTWGQYVAPFKSALFSVAERAAEQDGDMLVQPVTLSYVSLNGQPMVRSRRPWVAWIGDVSIVSHLKRFFTIGRIEAVVILHDPVHLKDFGNRKAIAQHCETTVREGLESLHRLEYLHGPQKHRGSVN